MSLNRGENGTVFLCIEESTNDNNEIQGAFKIAILQEQFAFFKYIIKYKVFSIAIFFFKKILNPKQEEKKKM